MKAFRKQLSFYIFIVFGLTIFPIGLSASETTDSLHQVYLNGTNDSIKIVALIKLGDVMRMKNPDSSYICYAVANDHAVKFGYTDLQEKSMTGLAIYHAFQGNFPKAMEKINRSMQMVNQQENPLRMAQLYNNKGTFFGMQGMYDSSIQNFIQGLEIAEELNELEAMSQGYNNVGIVQRKLGENEKALQYYNKALDIHNKLGHRENMIATINNIGSIYNAMNQPREAIGKFKQGLKLIDADDVKSLSIYYSNLGEVYSDINNIDSALYFLRKAVALYKFNGEKSGLSKTSYDIAKVHMNEEKYDSSLIYSNASLELGLEIGVPERIMGSYELLSIVNEKTGNYKQALVYFQKLATISDSLEQSQMHEKIAEIQSKYEADKKDRENALLRKEFEIKEFALERQTYLRNFFVFLSILVIVAVFLIFRRYRISQRTAHEFETKNSLINEQKQQLTKTLDEIKSLNKELEIHKTNLEEKVKERVAELEMKNQELENYNSLFVGREFRIKELKDQLKALKEKQGEEES